MQHKSDKYGKKCHQNVGMFEGQICPKMPFKLELEPWQEYGGQIPISTISLRFPSMKYAVLFTYEARENMKW